MIKIKSHPTLGIMVRSDGMILVPATKKSKEHWTYGVKNSYGYYMVGINYKTYPVHRLVCETFHNKVEGKNIVDHRDRNPSNNDESNLRWVTVQENCYNKSLNLPEGSRRKDMTKKEYDKLRNARSYEKHKDYYKTEEYKLKKKLYYQKCKEAKCA